MAAGLVPGVGGRGGKIDGWRGECHVARLNGVRATVGVCGGGGYGGTILGAEITGDRCYGPVAVTN